MSSVYPFNERNSTPKTLPSSSTSIKAPNSSSASVQCLLYPAVLDADLKRAEFSVELWSHWDASWASFTLDTYRNTLTFQAPILGHLDGESLPGNVFSDSLRPTLPEYSVSGSSSVTRTSPSGIGGPSCL